MAHVEDRWKLDPARKGQGKRWRVRWRNPAGQDRNRSFDKRSDAELFRAELVRELNRGTYVDRARGRETIGTLADLWLTQREPLLAPSTIYGYRGVLTNVVLPRWKDYPVDSVTFAEVSEWVSELARQGVSAQRIRHGYGIVAQILDEAVAHQRIALNPVRGVKLPRLPSKRRHRYLSHEEVFALADAMRDGRDAILTLAYCGFRWSELVALDVRHVDTHAKRIHVDRKMTEIAGHLTEGEPKTFERRSVPVPQFVLDELDLDNGGVLCHAPQGGRWYSTAFRRRLTRAIKTSGVDQLTTLDLRHTAASLAVSAGANVLAVARMLGHDPSVTLSTYADLFDSDLDSVAVSLETATRKLRTGLKVVELR